jgi:hypothetical protein
MTLRQVCEWAVVKIPVATFEYCTAKPLGEGKRAQREVQRAVH